MEERSIILTMLKEGKITAEEAEKLLAALDEDLMEEEEVQLEKEEGKSKYVETETNFGLIDKLINVLNFGSNIGPVYVFTEDYKHNFTSKEIELDIKTKNGYIKINTWNKDYAFVKVTKTVRGIFSGEKAEDLVKSYKVLKLKENGIETENYKNRRLKIDYDITLPQNVVAELYTTSTNGKVDLQNLKLVQGKINSVNGKINIDNVFAKEMEISGVNGIIKVEGEIENLKADTVNGGISLVDKGNHQGDVHLSTVNGSIRLSLPEGVTGVYIKSNSVNGRTKVEHTDLKANILNGKFLARNVEVTSPGEIKRNYKISTVNGSLSITEIVN
ncbi:DUF4097 family beta strand repeat-containing protein [Anaerobranca gottschalkii]|uniref:DUF4097 and DUF4098 domain-containing protein YvlB n=1 Tax=Anaerobranca gottschalkii DSM 13577 TaxID=1120990 RepID=A0A1I0CFP3_9FIRM|nr:DUF4097 family beta strand repeat-containing protein [Anaerobranca gottschalkii]SET18417.1 DUF4097 and DUF4098 domain-containing protein YvlB [Anaerobranca gottschalkii DSM 13577]